MNIHSQLPLKKTLYTSRSIHTLDAARPIVEAFLVQGNTILATGSRTELETELRAGDTVVDLPGVCVLPGLVDGHTHFSSFSVGLDHIPLDGAKNKDEVLARVARQLSKGGLSGGWLLSSGWNRNDWPDKRFPTAVDLDRVTGKLPAALTSKDGHAVWVNSAALQFCNVQTGTPDIPGGRILRDINGLPTGVFLENAQNLIWQHVPHPSDDEICRAITRGVKAAHQVGLTGIHNVEGRASRLAFGRLAREGMLPFRVLHHIPEKDLEAAIQLGLQSFTGGPFLRLGGVKIFTDGSLGSQTAWMLSPFEGSATNVGVATHTPTSLREVLHRSVRAGISCTIHAIGDQANRETLDALAPLCDETSRLGLRHRIEHAQLLHPNDLNRLAALGVVASMQPLHATSDRDLADTHWGTRSRYAYAFRSLRDRGTMLAFGSDVPVESIDPLLGIFAAVTRKRAQEPNRAAWNPQERLTAVEAVEAYTIGNAYAARQESILGRLSPGYLADFICLDHNIFLEEPEVILETRVAATYVDGKRVYQR